MIQSCNRKSTYNEWIFMIELPVFTVIIVTVAALLYCGKQVSAWVSDLIVGTIRRQINQIDKLHETTRKEIEVEFDLWWSGEPSRTVREKMMDALPLPQEMIDHLPEPMLRSMIEPYRTSALHLATHARMERQYGLLVQRAPRFQGFRDALIESRQEHDEEPRKEQIHLLQAGLNVDEILDHFAHSS